MINSIISQLKAALPKNTDDFTTNLSITSLTRSGSVVTATTSSDHNLIANDYALITDAITPVLLDSLTRIGQYAIAITNTPHPLGSGDETVVISGAVETDYNGTKDLVWTPPSFTITSITTDGSTATVTTLTDHGFLVNANFKVRISGVNPNAYNKEVLVLSTPTSNTFTCSISGTDISGANAFGQTMKVRQILNAYTFIFTVENTPTTPATGTIYQLSTNQDGYNGYKAVISVPTTTTFTYSIASTPLSPAQGSIQLKTNPTIITAPDIETMQNIFVSKFKSGDPLNWIFLVMANNNASRDKSMSTDAIAQLGVGTSTRLAMIQPFDLYFFTKTADTEYYTDAIQKVYGSYLQAVVKSLVNFRPVSPFSDSTYTGIALTGHGFSGLNSKYYIHRYSFETHNYISNSDQVNLPDSVPLREVTIDIVNPEQDDYVVATVVAQVDQES